MLFVVGENLCIEQIFAWTVLLVQNFQVLLCQLHHLKSLRFQGVVFVWKLLWKPSSKWSGSGRLQVILICSYVEARSISLKVLPRKVTRLTTSFCATSSPRLTSVSLQTKRCSFNLVLKAVAHVVVRWIIVVPSIWVSGDCRTPWHHQILVTTIEHGSRLVVERSRKLVFKSCWTALVHARRAKLWQSFVIRIVKTVIVRQIYTATRCIKTALTFCLKLVLPLTLKFCSDSRWMWPKKFDRISVHKVLMHFAGRTSSEAGLVEICYTFLLL